MLQWLGLDDRKAAATLLGCVLFVVLLVGVLPAWLHRDAAADFAGASERTASGIVSLVTISPISTGGGDIFNAVDVLFAGHQAYYALPPQSRWKPIFHEPVTVRYRVGRSGRIQVDSVTPLPKPKKPISPFLKNGFKS